MGTRLRKLWEDTWTWLHRKVTDQSDTGVRKHLTLCPSGRWRIRCTLAALVFSLISPKQMTLVTVHFCRKYRARPRTLVPRNGRRFSGAQQPGGQFDMFPTPYTEQNETIATRRAHASVPLQEMLKNIFNEGHKMLETFFLERGGYRHRG